MVRRVVARLEPALVATLRDLRPLIYADGGSPGDDRPAHVRSASSVRRLGSRLVIVQDDVQVLAFVARDGVEAVLLPRGEGGRRVFDDGLGNKHAKMDLEAGVRLDDDRLLALGSGSTPARERMVLLERDAVRVIEASALYAALRAEPRFSGSELNVEGAVVIDGALRLFQRGNGAPREGLAAVNATVDLVLAEVLAWLDGAGPPPALGAITQYDLGAIQGASYGFTDAAIMADGRVAFVACAEASPDVVRDGEVLGCRFGLLEPTQATVTEIVEVDGQPTRLKIEGIEPRPEPGAFDVVVDMDRPDEPSRIGLLHVTL